MASVERVASRRARKARRLHKSASLFPLNTVSRNNEQCDAPRRVATPLRAEKKEERIPT
jgi:hypothetical protein